MQLDTFILPVLVSVLGYFFAKSMDGTSKSLIDMENRLRQVESGLESARESKAHLAALVRDLQTDLSALREAVHAVAIDVSAIAAKLDVEDTK